MMSADTVTVIFADGDLSLLVYCCLCLYDTQGIRVVVSV
jgi:hypothetical protein